MVFLGDNACTEFLTTMGAKYSIWLSWDSYIWIFIVHITPFSGFLTVIFSVSNGNLSCMLLSLKLVYYLGTYV